MSAAPSEPTFAQSLSEGSQFVSTLSQGSSPQSRFADLRSVQWRINLGILPSSCDSSIEDLRRVAADSRRRYAGLRRRLLVDPHFSKDDNKAPDLVIDNPLSQNPDSTWGRFFKNAELEKMVDQDLSRLYPEHGSYFQTMACQAMLRRILLLWCLRHPEYGYRQGMHELLAPFLYVLHVDAQHLSQVRELYEDVFSDKFDGMSFLESDLNFSKTASPVSSRRSTGNNENDFQEGGVKTYSSLDELDPEIRTIVLLSDAYGAEGELGVLLSEKFMEHDAYCMFDALMSGAYGVVAMADFFSPAPAIGSLTSLPPVIEASSALYHLLSIVDSSLHSHLVELGVEPQYFSLRWLRVLFGREFSLEDLLVIWDEIFASPNGKSVLGSENDMVCQFMILTSSRGAFIIAMAVSMLLQLRSSLLATENATLCLQRLLNFPENINVKKLIGKAKSLQALALDRSVFASPSSGTFGRSKPAHVRGYSISGGSVSPRTPLNLLSESYWEEKWRVLHKEEANNQRGSGDPISSGTKRPTVKERLSLTRTESAPSPAKTPNGKNSRFSVRRRLLEDLSKELGESEADFDKSSSSEIASSNTALSAVAEKSFVDQSGQNGLSEESEADFDKCSSTEIVSSKFPLSVHVQKSFVDDQSGQNGLAGDSCLDRHISSEENSLIFSASTSPCSRAQDHENDSEKSSVSSNSCIYENEDEINNPEPCSSTVSDNPPIMDSKLEEEGTEKILSDPGGNAKQVPNPKERKPLSGKLQWFWRFGRNNGEGTSEKGGNSEAQASLNSPSGASNVDECHNSCGVNGTLDNTLDKNVTGTLRNLGQSMLENIQVIESVFQQDRGQVGSLENLSKTLLSGKGQVTAMAALKELRKISNLLSEM